MAGIGIDGRGTDLAQSFFERMELLGAAFEGERTVEAAAAAAGVAMNGWRVTPIPGSPEAYDGDWLTRAVVTKAGIYGNTTTEATYPFTRADATGAPLDGSNARYTLTFGPNQLAAGQRLLVGDDVSRRQQLLVQNPIDRYLINSPMLNAMRRNPDGGLTIHIQKDDPRAPSCGRTGCRRRTDRSTW